MTYVRLCLSLIGSALLLALTGCGSSTATHDAGPTPELEPLAAYEERGMGEDVELVARTLDYACLGERTKPQGGDPVPTTFQLRDFQDGFEVENAEVWIFRDNVIADSCAEPTCSKLTTDTNGNAMVSLPAGGWYAYRVIPNDTPISQMEKVFGVFQYNEPAPLEPNGSVTGNSVSGTTIEVVPATLGIPRTPGLAIVAGRVEDCAGGFVQNAIIRMYDPDGNAVTEANGPRFHYFNGDPNDSIPSLAATSTAPDGLYVVLEVPVQSERPYRVEAWGNLDGEFRMLGCEAVRIFPDAVTILNMIPLRADAPQGCVAE